MILLLQSAVFGQTVPSLTGLNPTSASWDTSNLQVSVGGSNFQSGAIVRFTCSTCNQPGITVRSTTFNNPSQLTTFIDIDMDAEAVPWEVSVLNPDGTVSSNTLTFTVTSRNLTVNNTSGDAIIEAGNALRYNNVTIQNGRTLTVRDVHLRIDGSLFILGNGILNIERGARLLPPPVINATRGTITGDQNFTLDGSTITLGTSPTTTNGLIRGKRFTINADTLTIHPGSQVNVNAGGERGGDGCDRSSNPGGGPNNYKAAEGQAPGQDTGAECAFSAIGGGGGGGYGGAGRSGEAPGGSPTYGNPLAPIDLGSGGGKGTYFDFTLGIFSTAAGGNGGGAIKINVTGTLTNNGQVLANGGNGKTGLRGGGGGSGGSIYAIADVLAGSGNISANGGNAGGTGAGGGGGGRIVLYSNNSTQPAFNLTCVRGSGGAGGGIGTCGGGSGGLLAIGSPPTFSSLSPVSLGQGATNKTVTINGGNFVDGTTVSFSGTGISVNSATLVDNGNFDTLTADVTVSPTGTPGSRGITVTNPDGTSVTASNAFTVAQGPSVTSIKPSRFDQGATNVPVVVKGDNFQSGSTLSIGGSGITVSNITFNATTQEFSATLSVETNATTSQRDVIVTNPDGGRGVGLNLLTVERTPVLNALTPAGLGQGAVSQTLTLSGLNFSSGATVSISGSGDVTPGTAVFVNSTTLTVPVSVSTAALTGGRDVTVTSNGKTSTCSGCLTIVQGPSVNDLSPDNRGRGATGQTVTVNGSGFQNGAGVTFSGGGITIASTNVLSANQISLNLNISSSAATGSRDVTVTNPDGGRIVGTGLFTVNPTPTVLSITPQRGDEGQTLQVTVSGSGFQNDAILTISGSGLTLGATTFVNSSTLQSNVTISPTAPPGSRDVTVANSDGGSTTQSGLFTVDAVPVVDLVSPLNAVQGDFEKPMTITGSGFVNGLTVSFGSSGITTSSLTVTSLTQIDLRMIVPFSTVPGSYTVTVNNPGGKTANGPSPFTVTAASSLVVNNDTTLTSSDVTSFMDVTVTAGNTLTLQGAVTLSVRDNVQINAGASISADGTGCPFDQGFETGGCSSALGTAGRPNGISGGGHGGTGGKGFFPLGGTIGGSSYGSSIAPETIGAGGGGGGDPVGGSGGGAIKLVVGGVLQLDGTLSSRGENGVDRGGTEGSGGGGAGGSLYAIVDTLAGSGAIDQRISAKGGNAGDALGTGRSGGGGGGGRIAIYYDTDLSSFTGISIPTTSCETVLSPGGSAGTGGNPGSDGSCIIALQNTPAISDISGGTPFTVFPGDTNRSLVINGSGFQQEAKVSFSGNGVTVTSTTVSSAFEIIVTVNVASEASTGLRSVTVSNPDGSVGTGTDLLNISAIPSILSVSPASLDRGGSTSLIITGTDFQNSAILSMDGGGFSSSSCTFNSSTQLTCVVTSSTTNVSGSRTLTVTNPDGGAGSRTGLFQINSNPQLTSVAPGSSPPGSLNQELILQGSGFINGVSVTIDCDTTVVPNCTNGISVIGNTAFDSFNQIRVAVDILSTATIGVRDITIDNLDGGRNTFRGAFEIEAIPATTVQGLATYGEGTVNTPRSRLWNGLGWSQEESAQSGSGEILWSVIRSNPVRDEAVLATLDSQKRLTAQVWNGSQWGNLIELAFSSGANNVASRSFDIAFDATGKAIVVYGTTGGQAPRFRTWDGSNWSAEQVINVTGTFGVPVWVRLVSKSSGEEAILVYKDSFEDINALVWSGSQFGNERLLTLEGTPVLTSGFDIAYESQSGRAMVVWSKAMNSIPRHRIWNGSAWESEGQALSFAGSSDFTLNHLRLVSDPQSNQMALGISNQNKTIEIQFWDSTGWVSTGTRTPFQVTEGIGSLKLTSLTPNVLVRGDTNQSLVMIGKNFEPGATISFSGSGVTVNSVTVDSPTQITLDVTISGTADLGDRVVTLTNPGGKRISVGRLFTIKATISDPGLIRSKSLPGRNFDMAWESKRQELVVVYGVINELGGAYRTWSSGSGWSSAISLSAGSRIPEIIQLRSNPSDNELLLGILDRKIDENDSTEPDPQGLTAHRWNGFGWDRTTVLDSNPSGRQTYFVSTIGENAFVYPESFMISFAQHKNFTGVTVAGASPSQLDFSSTQTVILTGTGFVNGSTVTISGDGLNLSNINIGSSTQMTLDVTVAGSGSATPGARNVTVTLPDGRSAAGIGIIAIGPASTSSPNFSGVTPGILNQGAMSIGLKLEGSGFQSLPSVEICAPSACDDNLTNDDVTVQTVSFINSSQVNVTVDVAGNAPSGVRDIKLTNPDNGSVVATGLLSVEISSSADLVVSGINLTLTENATYQNITIQNGWTLTLQGDITLKAREALTVGGSIVAAPSNNFVTIKATDLNVEVGGTISSNGRGCAATVGCGSNGLGAGESNGVGGAGGGAHGGKGGNSGNSGGLGSGNIYGTSLDPVTQGSGGGNGAAAGGGGGGALKLEVTGVLAMNGSISVDGNPGINNNTSAGGGGSGGSLSVIANTLTYGSSGIKLSARGGNGGVDNEIGNAGLDDGGGGGGGRIAVYTSSTNNNTTNQMDCGGGTRGGSTAQNGSPGTCMVFLSSSPSVTSIAPSVALLGTVDQNITVKGSNFRSGATVSMGAGVTVNLVKFISSVELIANIDVDSTAPPGARDVIVANPLVGSSPSGNSLLTLIDGNDTTPPGAITDLVGVSNGTNGINLTWTAPANDGSIVSSGKATAYDVRISTSQITSQNFSGATPVLGFSAPANPGTTENLAIQGLVSGRTYYFALKAQDGNGNVSAISNVISITLQADTTPPAQIADLSIGPAVTGNSIQLLWSSPEEDGPGSIGAANHYIVKFSLNTISSQVDFNNASSYRQFLIPKSPGSQESLTLLGLVSNTRYYFAVVGVDEAGNQGPISNVATAATLANEPTNDQNPPSPVTDLQVISSGITDTTLLARWTATGDDGNTGTATGYDLRYSSMQIVESGGDGVQSINFADATQAVNLPNPKVANSVETYNLTGLTPNTIYHLAIKVFDDGYNGGSQGISAISNVVSTRTALRNGYNMVSVPVSPIPDDVVSVFGDDVGSSVSIFGWNSTGLAASDGSYQIPSAIEPGTGYFLFSFGNLSVIDAPTGSAGNSAPTTTLQLNQGWNMIGNPYDGRVSLSNIQIRRAGGTPVNFQTAVSNGWVGNSVYIFNGSTFDFSPFNGTPAAILEPWKGYWFQVLINDSFEMIITQP